MRERAFVADAREAKGLHDGSITRVVRVMKCQPGDGWGVHEHDRMVGDGKYQCWTTASGRCGGSVLAGDASPFGVPGDRLWVAEEWSPWADKATESAVALKGEKCVYRVDYQSNVGSDLVGGDGRWRSSTRMPRWASRTLLDVTDVRVMQAKAVSEEDAKATGLLPLYPLRDDGKFGDWPSFALALRKLYGGDTWLWLGSVRGETKGD